MGKGFGELYKLRNIVTYRLSPFEQRAFAGFISHGLPNMVRRVREEFLYVVPPFVIAYTIYDQVEKENARLIRKNPADYENEQ